MALYTYDEEADALYILLATEDDAEIHHTVELGERLHVDIGPDGELVGVEILYPSRGRVDLEPVRTRYALDLKIPFTFAA